MSTFESPTVLRAAVFTAYGLAPAKTAAKLVSRLRAETLQVLDATYAAPPQRAVEAVLASGDRELTARLARNEHLDEEAAVQLAREGDPVIARALLANRFNSELVREAVWEAADPASEEWYSEVVEPLLENETFWRLRSALRAPFPDLVRHAVALLAASLPPWIVVDCASRIVALAPLAEARPELMALAKDFRDDDDELLHPGMAALLHEAAEAEDPASALRDARVRLSGRREPRPEHDAWMVGLRFGGRADTPPGGVDWAAVLRENARHPYASEAGIELTRHAGCPTELVYQAVRGGVGSFAGERLGPVPFAAVLPPEVPDERKLVDLLVWGIKGGRFAVDDVLREVTPAGAVLDALHRMSPRPAEAGAAGTTTAPSFAGSGAYRGHLPRALAPAVARLIEPLGDAPDAWNSLYKLAVRFPGTCRELVATAVEQAATARVNGTPVAWPRDLAARFPAEAPEGARRRLYGLLAAAPEHVQRAVIPALDLRAVQQLTVYYPLSAAVRAHIHDVLGTEAAVANAAHWEMPTDVVDALLDMNDPDVNASLYDFGAITQDERIRICAGRPRGGGDHTVPISSALVDLLARTSPSTRRNWLLAPLDSGSPKLVRAMLGRTRLHTEVGRLRVAIGLWQRHGPDAVAALLDETDYPGRRPSAKHPFPPATHRALRTALAAATPEAGLASLRDALAAARTPEAVAHYLVDRPAKADERLEHFDAEYGIPLPWNYLVASDGEQPLPARLLAALAAQPGCPRHLLTAFLARTKLPARMLGMDWLPTALSEGRLLATDLLTLAAPAGAVVEYLTRDAPTGDAAAEHMAVPRTETLTLMAEAGFDPADAEHWAVAIRLLPDFTGTIPELLSTTAAIVR